MNYDFYFQSLVNHTPHLARIVGFVLIAPPLSSPFFPRTVKIMLILAFWFSSFQPNPDPLQDFLFPSLFNLFFGFLLGFLVLCLFSIFDWTGEIISSSIGLSMPGHYSPLTSQSAGPLSSIGYLLGVIFFIQFGGLELLLSLVRESFQFSLSWDLFLKFKDETLILLTSVIRTCLNASFVIWGSLLLANLCLLFASRLSGGLNLISTGLPILLALGLVLFFIYFQNIYIFLSRFIIDRLLSIF